MNIVDKSTLPEIFEGTELAVVGMAGRFPGAKDIESFWNNLRNGVNSISHFTLEELKAAGVAESSLANPSYVRAKGMLEDSDLFDAAFFGYTPGEAEGMDPQQRLFLECVWEAMENAGYSPEETPGEVGLFAGVSMSTYFLMNLL